MATSWSTCMLIYASKIPTEYNATLLRSKSVACFPNQLVISMDIPWSWKQQLHFYRKVFKRAFRTDRGEGNLNMQLKVGKTVWWCGTKGTLSKLTDQDDDSSNFHQSEGWVNWIFWFFFLKRMCVSRTQGDVINHCPCLVSSLHCGRICNIQKLITQQKPRIISQSNTTTLRKVNCLQKFREMIGFFPDKKKGVK